MQATVQVDSSGVVSVLFDGALIACAQDIDCPGAAICSRNPKGWISADPNGALRVQGKR